jgi:hypothetical protein
MKDVQVVRFDDFCNGQATAVEYPFVLLRERPEPLIAKGGSIKSLDLNEGQCWLAKSALEAVHQWRYQPSLVDGDPVEVETTINVMF